MRIKVEATLLALTFATILVTVHSAFELPTGDSLITDTLVFATRNIGFQAASYFHITFSSTSDQSAHHQASIINDFLVKAELEHLIRLDDIRRIENLPPERRKFTLSLVDSEEAFEGIKLLLEARQYHNDGKHLVLISQNLPGNDTMELLQKMFDIFFERHIVNVVVIARNETTSLMDFYTFFPVTSTHCFKVIPILEYTFDGSDLGKRFNLFPRKFDNFFGCSLTLVTFQFPPHVFLRRRNNDSSVQGSGIDVKVLYEIARKMNFRVVIIDSGERGVMLPNGTLSGALKLLKGSQGNITVGGFGSSSKAMLQFTHSVAYLHTSMVFAIPPLQEFSPLERLLLPFDSGVWIAILLTFGLTFLASLTLETWCKSVRDLVFGDTVKQPVFEMIIIYLGGAIVRFPSGNFARNTILQWLIVSLILSSCYKAILFGMLKTGFLKKYPTTIEGMLDFGFVIDVPLPLMQNLKEGPLGNRNGIFISKCTFGNK